MNKPSNKRQILHITPHLGGGVGRVVTSYLQKECELNNNIHSVICLDTVTPEAAAFCSGMGVTVSGEQMKTPDNICQHISQADLVLIHWWNHPLLFQLLTQITLPACRLAIWSHISGATAPNVITDKIIAFADKFIFTTPLSFDYIDQQKHDNKLSAIWSTAGLDYVTANVTDKQQTSNFTVGYLGTVDFAKLDKNVLALCEPSKQAKRKYIFCGGNEHQYLSKLAEKRGISELVNFTGPVSDINHYLNQFDIFGYPLAKHHYGTCDQVLAEAMAAGVVPVVFDNPMECYMVKHMETGLVVHNEQEYRQAVNLLESNIKLRKRLAENAVKYARSTFTLAKLTDDWQNLFTQLLSQPKRKRQWQWQWQSDNKEIRDAADIFLESLDEKTANLFMSWLSNLKLNEGCSQVLENEIYIFLNQAQWQPKTKGTIQHYLSFYPDDEYLNQLQKIATATKQ